MVNHSSERLDLVFHALSDPTRRAMLRRLSEGEIRVTDLAEPFEMSLAGASKHLRALENAGLVQRTIRGRTHYCRLDVQPLLAVDEWISFYTRFWNERLDDLERELKREDPS